MTSAMHGVGESWRHPSARVTPAERENVQRILGSLAPLFFELPVNDQRHGIDVLETVTRLDGYPDVLLQQAALLHDLGKGVANFSIVERSLTVFLRPRSRRTMESLLRSRS